MFLKVFFDFTMSEKNGKFSDMFFLMFFMVEFMFFNDEIYDLVSLGFEEKSRKTQKNNHTKIKNHKNIIKKNHKKKHKKKHKNARTKKKNINFIINFIIFFHKEKIEKIQIIYLIILKSKKNINKIIFNIRLPCYY